MCCSIFKFLSITHEKTMFPSKLLAAAAIFLATTSIAPTAFATFCGRCDSSDCVTQDIPAQSTYTRTIKCPSTHYAVVQGFTIIGSDHAVGGCDAFNYAVLPNSTSNEVYASCSSTTDYTSVESTYTCGDQELSQIAVRITCKNLVNTCTSRFVIDSACRIKLTAAQAFGASSSASSSQHSTTVAPLALLGLVASAIATAW